MCFSLMNLFVYNAEQKIPKNNKSHKHNKYLLPLHF
jgi:hypothetical protein